MVHFGVSNQTRLDSINWNTIGLRDKPVTYHGILSTISSVYDPLGAVSTVILNGKQILQALCLQNVSSDDTIPDDILPLWEKWQTELPLLEKLTFPRCLKPPEVRDPVKTETHSFAGASDSGIGQTYYLRMINQRNEVHFNFLMAKSIVAQIKPISIPRLELTAANVTAKLKSEFGVDNVQCYYYTDSEIVIGYINNDARRFHVYVGNRVQHIRDGSSPEERFHVPGKENPADEGSRGFTARELMQSNRWSKDQVFCAKKINFS